MAKFDTHDAYLATCPDKQRAALEDLRAMIHRAAPNATECMYYGIPAFRQGRPLVGFAGMTAHCGFYVLAGETLAGFADELAEFSVAKGTVRFTPEHPLPEPLVARIVRARLAEIGGS